MSVLLRHYAEAGGIQIVKQVAEMLEADIAQFTSSWVGPVVLVEKNGGLRFCVNYRHLNKVTAQDCFPLSRSDNTIDAVKRGRVFSSLDLRAGYWRIHVSDSDRFRTASRAASGLYEFGRIQFGLATASSTFLRAMNNVLGALKGHACRVCLDHVLMIAATSEDHLSNLDKVISAFFSAGFRLNREKASSALQVPRKLVTSSTSMISAHCLKNVMPSKHFRSDSSEGTSLLPETRAVPSKMYAALCSSHGPSCPDSFDMPCASGTSLLCRHVSVVRVRSQVVRSQ